MEYHEFSTCSNVKRNTAFDAEWRPLLRRKSPRPRESVITIGVEVREILEKIVDIRLLAGEFQY